MWVAVGNRGVLCYCIYLPVLNVSALYINNSLKFSSVQPDFLRCISRIQFGPELYPFNLHYDIDILRHVWKCYTYDINNCNTQSSLFIHNILNGTISLPISKVSARHLRHVTWREIASLGISNINSKCSFLFNHIYRHRDDPFMTEAYVCGLLLWTMNLKPDMYTLVSTSTVWDVEFNNLVDFLSYIKREITLKLKALQNVLSHDLSQCFEFEVLVNRGVGTVDWNSEKEHRTQPSLCNLDPSRVYNSAFEIFSSAAKSGVKPTKREWEPFWATRWKWAPAGSYYSQYTEDEVYRANESTLRNKIYSLCAMPDRPVSHFLDRRPQLRAKAMTKYEWGKQRAIYSVDNTSFILSQFAMGDCEKVLSRIFPIGPSAGTEQVREDVSELLKNGIPYCFDFEDFNSQHSTENMQLVLCAYRDMFRHRFTLDQINALNWQIAALQDVEVLQPDGSVYTSRGTLLSGWRLTTFMNTVLNKIYINACLPNINIVTLHNGDDVLAAVQSMSQVNTLMYNARQLNIRFQPSKCFLGAIAEFLRVDHKTGNGTQYLARAIATYVHAPTESIMPNDLLAVLRSQQTRMIEVLDRGGSEVVMTRLCAAQTRFISKIWNVHPKDIDIIRKTHVSSGGINDVLEPGGLDHQIDRVPVVRQFDPGGKLVEDMRRPLPGVNAYVGYLVSKFNLRPYASKLLHSVRKSIYATTLLHKYTVVITIRAKPIDPIHYVEAAQYRMYKGEADNQKTMLAKAFNIPLFEFTEGMSLIVEALRWVLEPLKTLILWS